MAQRKLTKKEFEEFKFELQILKTSTDPDKDKKLDDFYDKYESNLNYVGCSAIEDKLQNFVPETISTLIETNIRVWVLTGDKQETAIEIGKSCQLIQTDMRQIVLTSDTRQAFEAKLNEELSMLQIDIT